MPKSTDNRVYDSRLSAASARLVNAHQAPSLEEITPQRYARLSEAQKKQMVDKLIDFLKSI